MKRNPAVLVVIAVLVAGMLFTALYNSRRSNSVAAASLSFTGQSAPDFALQSLEGKTVHLSDFHGKAVVLNFWATWCQPCKIEMPWFEKLQKQYEPQGLQIIGVAMDDASKEEIVKFAAHVRVSYPVLLGKEEVGNAYGGVQFLPATFYISRDGKVVDKVFGLKGRAEIEDNIKRALAQSERR